MSLFDIRAHDGSRHFADLPESRSWSALQRHLRKLPGVAITNVISDGFTEVWIDFTLEGHEFSINNQFGEYWFFVRDPGCKDQVLESVVSHCVLLLGSSKARGAAPN